MSIKIDVSVGEIMDKLTILEIKSEKIQDEAKLANVLRKTARSPRLTSVPIRQMRSDNWLLS